MSYWYWKNEDLDKVLGEHPATTEMMFADSGGFSAYTKGVSISPEEYAEWLRRWAHRFSDYANLDEIRNADGTARNQRILESMGLEPVPVFHAGSPIAELEPLLDRYRYIALGGLVGAPRAALMRWLIECFRRAERTGTVYHGFGQTAFDVVGMFPFYSVDSNSWCAGARFGNIPLFDGKGITAVKNGKAFGAGSANVRRIRMHGSSPEALRRGTDIELKAVGASAFVHFARMMRRRHGDVPLDGKPPGPHVYLAVSGARDAKAVLLGSSRMEKL